MRGMILAVLMSMGATATAQTVTFRSGDHADFARLVLDIPPGRDWTMGRAGEDYVLDLGPGLAFDLSGAFARIPRDRLRDIEVEAESGRLLLRLGCACHASAFLFQPDKLVIDVTDGPAPPGSPWETALPAVPTALPPQLPLFSDIDPALLLPPLVSRLQEARPSSSPALPEVDSLAIDMARAVAAGVLDPAATGPEAAAPIPAEEPGPAEPPAALAAEAAGQPGIAFIAADALQRSVPGAREAGAMGETCRPEVDFDVASWAPTGEFSRDIGALRSQIIDAAGVVDRDAVTALARAYLHYGFGAEAKHVLTLTGEDSTTLRLLRQMSDIVDGRPVPPEALADQAGCLTPATLWSAMARGSIAGRTAEERIAIETAFRVLPSGLRRVMAPRLAAMFLAEGFTESAAAILERMPEQASGTDESLAVESDIIRDAASAAAARDVLLDAIRNGSRASAGSMIRLVDATIAADLPVEPWMIETLTALRFEYGESAMATTLAATELEALVATGRFVEANVLLAETDLPIGPEDRRILGTDLALALAARASDADFLEIAFARSFDLAPGAVANSFAERLIALGFPDVALDILAPPAAGGAMAERRRLRAAALQALGKDEEAARVLAGMATAEEDLDSAAAAWRSSDWEALLQADDPLLRAVAEGILRAAPLPAADNSLAERAALIDAAEETRRLTTALLDRFPAPEATALSPGGQP